MFGVSSEVYSTERLHHLTVDVESSARTDDGLHAVTRGHNRVELGG